MRGTRVISARVPTPLYDRVNVLARKRLMTVNEWLRRLLERETRPKSHPSTPE
jgi:hypothetical protein